MDNLNTNDDPFQHIVESSDDFIVILDQNRRFLYLNHAVEGLEIGDVIGMLIEDFTPAAFRQIAIDVISQVFETGKPDSYETTALGNAGRLAHYLCRVSPIRDGDFIPAVSVIATNITTRKEYERKLESLNNDLERKVKERTRALEHLSRQIQTVQEQERKLLAHELHDQVGGTLTSLRLEMESALSGSIPPRLNFLFDSISRATRNISGNLRSSALDDFGLEAAVAELLPKQGSAPQVALQTSFQHDLESGQRFDPTVETVVYRVCQEALANTIRHAEATRFEILIAQPKHQLELTIEDDGNGFEPEKSRDDNERKRLGLVGMRDRVGLVGGSFELSTAPGNGTRIHVRLPLNSRNSSDSE